jgi:hypothetical protein
MIEDIDYSIFFRIFETSYEKVFYYDYPEIFSNLSLYPTRHKREVNLWCSYKTSTGSGQFYTTTRSLGILKLKLDKIYDR